MRSSACKYILDKVSKFEKKYAKPIQKSNQTNDDDFLSSKENSSSEHLVNNIKFIESNTISHSEVSKNHKERLNELGPLESKTTNDLDRQTLSKSLKDTSKTSEKERIYVIEKNNATESPHASGRYECDEDLKRTDEMFLSDTNEILLADKLAFNYSFEDVSQTSGFQFLKDNHDSAEHSLKDDLKSGEKKLERNGPKALLTVDNEEMGIKKGRLHVNLNLKLDEDTDEVSDISSKGIASLSLESSISSKNVPIRVFAFEDLIGAEDLKSVSEELKGNCEENSQLIAQTAIVDESVQANMLITNYLQRNSKSDESHETSRNFSEERLKELIANVDESSIEEDIEESIVSSNSDKNNYVSKQIHSSSESKTKVKENAFKSELGESNGKNMFRRDQCNDNHSYDESIPDFMEDDHRHITLQKNKSDISHEENSGNRSIKYKPRESSVMKNHSAQDLKASSDKPNRPRKKDSKYSEKSHKRKKYLENEWKLMRKSNIVLQSAARNAYTQTENFLAEAYDFEKRMETIMKTSLTSMAQVNSLTLEANNVHSEHTHTASAPSPLEHGFNCALKQQVELTKHFICAEYNMYAVCMAAIKEMSSSYKPATLHYNTKMMSGLSSKKATL
ncbi:Protein of unknown function [Gryllus bimaculatus]|nr:Protein of unknown function [Gryllus bimaculatus]